MPAFAFTTCHPSHTLHFAPPNFPRRLVFRGTPCLQSDPSHLPHTHRPESVESAVSAPHSLRAECRMPFWRLLLMLLTLSALLVLLVMVDSSTEPVTHKADDAAPKRSRKPLEEEKPLTTTAKRRGRRRRFADRWQPTTGGSAQSPPHPPNATIPPAAALTSIDPTCHGEAHRGYAGDGAVVWGLNFKLPSAAECCAACKAHAAVCSSPDSQGKSWWPSKPDMRCPRHHNPVRVCQIWTWCPEERCFAFDIHVHTFGECWLKFQDVDPTRPKDPHFGHTSYPEAMRRSPRKLWPWAVKEEIWPGEMPQRVPWTSGVIAPADTVIVSSEPNDRWRERWCSKHGPC